MNILYATGEAYPFIMTGGLGDVAGALPRAIYENSVDCRVVLPLYSDIPKSIHSKLTFVTSFTVSLSWRQQYCGIYKTIINDITYYLLDNEYYFKRSGIYGHFDDGERFAFFSLAVLEMLHYIDYQPDIIHSNDWHTALIPVFRNLIYGEIKEYNHIKTVFTIHNIIYQGQYGFIFLTDVLGLNPRDTPILEYNGCINLMKAAIVSANAVTTVSPTYASELMFPFYAHGLEGILQNNSYKLTGIINGIDIDVYNPETDLFINTNYSYHTTKRKKSNKIALQQMFHLPTDETIPIIGMVTRLVDHKGLDLLNAVIEELLSTRIQLIILGKGDQHHEAFYEYIASRYPNKMAIKIGFFPDIAHMIYAGSDMFLMPSKSEPCGLSQMVSLRYGTIPIVRETGGLKDTVTDCGDGKGNGFTFQTYNAHDMLDAIHRAYNMYARKKDWEILIKRAMSSDFSWENSANLYIKLYKSVLQEQATSNY